VGAEILIQGLKKEGGKARGTALALYGKNG